MDAPRPAAAQARRRIPGLVARGRSVGAVEEPRRRGLANAITADGLHLLKRRFQKRFLAQQCTQLAHCLEDAIAATLEAAPVREGKPYIQNRDASRKTRASEASWEDALFRQWRNPVARTYAPWARLLSYQINLQNKKREDTNWGEIDLLGVSDRGLPVVVELKAPGSNESPVQMLIQATAYGVALVKAWPQCFRAEWVKEAGVSESTLPRVLAICELVCAAPKEYWQNWTGDSSRARSVEPNVWASLADLRKALARRGYPSTFLRLNHTDSSTQRTQITLVEEHLPTG
jgi:hypothetical protein